MRLLTLFCFISSHRLTLLRSIQQILTAHDDTTLRFQRDAAKRCYQHGREIENSGAFECILLAEREADRPFDREFGNFG
jgi:hypothetical protein